jgi:23S rRNA (guanosine2251-2'-O)-methyltransferase
MDEGKLSERFLFFSASCYNQNERMNKYIILEGRNTIHDALISNKKIKSLTVASESSHDPKVDVIIKLAKKKNVELRIMPAAQLKQRTRSEKAQNIMAEMEAESVSLKEILESANKRGKDPFILLFNRLDYEQNLGAILRTAWGAGVDAVIVNPGGVHELTPVVTKVSMGGAVYVPLISESLFNALKLLKDYGIPIVGVESGMGAIYSELTLRGPIAFVLGGEDSGISEPLKKYCDIFVHIPMQSKLSSLNVSVATAIIAFEKIRQEREKGLV